MVDESIAERMVACAADFPKNESEISPAGLSLTPSEHIDVEYISEAPVALECRRVTVLQFAKTRDLAIGEIVGLHAKEGLIDPETKRINWDNYNPIGRLYANQYIRTHDRFSMNIPSPEDIISGKIKNFTKEK